MNDDNLLCFEGIKLRGLLLKPSIPCQPPHQAPTLSLPSDRGMVPVIDRHAAVSPAALADRKPNPLSALPLPLSILLSFGERLLDIFLLPIGKDTYNKGREKITQRHSGGWMGWECVK